jgi:tRNA threonylcarbamoyladenosine biosynthesis protein TsaB
VKLLAIDTTSDACSVALQVDASIAERHHVESRAHTRILLPMIRDLLDEKKLRTSDLDAVVLGNGPGSFIGMRISASVAQGICLGAGLPILPVSSLAAIASEVMVEESAGKVAVAQDARMNEVYFAAYRRTPQGLPDVTIGERIVAARDGGALPGIGWIGAGAGWDRYPELVSVSQDALSRLSTVRVPRARFLLPLGARQMQQGGAIDPKDLAPAYLRTRVAEPAAATG